MGGFTLRLRSLSEAIVGSITANNLDRRPLVIELRRKANAFSFCSTGFAVRFDLTSFMVLPTLVGLAEGCNSTAGYAAFLSK